jgi:hypothetical protein
MAAKPFVGHAHFAVSRVKLAVKVLSLLGIHQMRA